MPGAALRGYGRAFYKSGSSPAWTRKEGKSPSGGLNACLLYTSDAADE